jgi:hypothetical protein
VRPSERVEADIEFLAEFRHAFIDLINHARIDYSGIAAEFVPSVGDAEWNELRSRVARAAGAASRASAEYGGTLSVAQFGQVVTNMSPVTNWERSLRDPEWLRPDMVVGHVDAAIGLATVTLNEMRRRERGVVGLIASFLRWPQDLREAVGPGVAQRRVAGALGVFGQIVVGTISGALAVGLVALVVVLANSLFHSVQTSNSPRPTPLSSLSPTP